MANKADDIDIVKLRTLMRRRHSVNEQARELTDQFLDIRGRITRYDAQINARGRRIDKIQRDRELAEMEGLKEIRDQLEQDRAAAYEQSEALGFVGRLIEHAEAQGLHVDERKCTAYRPHKGQARRVTHDEQAPS